MSSTLSAIELRYQQLVGQPSGTIDTFGVSNINAAIKDILNKHKFSWNIASTTITLVNGSANLPADYNPIWHIDDARTTTNGVTDVFTQVSLADRDSYTDADYVYWITYDVNNDVYVFNSQNLTGTVTIKYNFIPADLSSASDKCFIPDMEAVSYLAASKKWVGAERDVDLKREYEAEADKLITAMYINDIQYGEMIEVDGVTSLNLF